MKGDVVQLLIRCEEQFFERLRTRRLRRSVNGRGKIMRAKKLVREGAYRKAVSSLTSSVADLSLSEQRTWFKKLLPNSDRSVSACCAPCPAVNSEGSVSDGSTKILQGVRFAALSAAGPSGARPEHLRDLLSVRSRAARARLFKAVGAFIKKGSNGQLPECC